MHDLKEAFAALASPDQAEPEEHSFEQWLIFRVRVGSEKIVVDCLRAAGCEAWYPCSRRYCTRPQRHLPSKTRHKRRFELIEKDSAAFPGYLFVRRIYDCTEDFRALPSLIEQCHFGEQAAALADFEIEILRREEARGRFDSFESKQAILAITGILKASNDRVQQR